MYVRACKYARTYSCSRRYYCASMIETAMKWVSGSRLPDSDFIEYIIAAEEDTLARESIQEGLFKEVARVSLQTRTPGSSCRLSSKASRVYMYTLAHHARVYVHVHARIRTRARAYTYTCTCTREANYMSLARSAAELPLLRAQHIVSKQCSRVRTHSQMRTRARVNKLYVACAQRCRAVAAARTTYSFEDNARARILRCARALEQLRYSSGAAIRCRRNSRAIISIK